MSVDLSPIGGAAAQFFDSNGVPLSGGKLYTYDAGTTTPKASYTTAAGTTAHANPIILDSGGRVSGGGEIWLTTGESYKFVLTSSTDTLVGTWDNIYGYSSGSSTAATEVQTATAGQTLFVLTTMAYNPGSNTLGVYIDGVNQVVNNSYIETNATSVTFVSGLHEGATVKFINLNIASTDASVVTYEPGFTGSIATTVAAKLQETVSVKDFGAVGDGVTDDADAIQAAIDYVVIDGGVLHFPLGIYRVTRQMLVGIRFVDESQIVASIDNYTVVPSYNSTLANEASLLPYVSIVAESGAVLWGDFAPATETAILYYGIKNRLQNTLCPFIEGLTIAAQDTFNAGVRVEIAGELPVVNNQMGLFFAGVQIAVQNITFLDLNRGIVSSGCYWSWFTKLTSFRSNIAFSFIGNNATISENLAAFYAHEIALVVSGQGLDVKGINTQQCVVDIYVPVCDNLAISGGYLEDTDPTHTDYSCKFGDGTRGVTFLTLLNLHVSRAGNKGLDLKKAQLTIIGSRSYTTSGIIADAASSAYIQTSTFAIDPLNLGVITNQTINTLQTVGGLYVGDAAVDTIDVYNKGFRFGNTRMWFDPTYGILKYKVGLPSGTTDGYSLVPIITQYSKAWGTIASGTYGADTQSAAFFTMGNQYSVSPLSALPTGVFMNAQCNANGSLTVYVWNFSGSSQVIGTVAYVITVSITV